MTERSFRLYPLVFWALVGAIIVLLFDTVVWWTVTDPFTGIFVDFITLVVAFLILLWPLVYGIRHWKKEGRKVWLPLAISLIALLCIWFLPFRSLMIKADFAINFSRRMEVVKMVEAGKLKPSASCNSCHIPLPPHYEDLSRGDDGQIAITQSNGHTTITFYTFLGILGHASGFMYKSDDSSPNWTDFEEEYWESERLRRHWFWTAC